MKKCSPSGSSVTAVQLQSLKVFFLMPVLGWQITQTIPYKFKWSQIISLFSEESSKQHIYFPSECSVKDSIWSQQKQGFEEKKKKTTLSQMIFPKFCWLDWILKSLLNLLYLKCTKSSLHGFGKECEILQRFYLRKSLEPNTVLSYKTFTEILKYLQSHLN